MYDIKGLKNISSVNNVWFTSDHFFGEDGICISGERPFFNAEEMGDTLISNWNKVVRPQDLVFHLGNFSVQDPEEIRKIIKRLNGKIYLVIGSIDTNSTILNCKDLLAGFAYKLDIFIDDVSVSMNHYPQLFWNRCEHGAVFIHGFTRYKIAPYHPLALDVTVDGYDGFPINMEEVNNIIKNRNLYSSRYFLTQNEEYYI